MIYELYVTFLILSFQFSPLLGPVSPLIVVFKDQVTYTIGTLVVLSCRAMGILPITYTWTRGRTEPQSPISTTEGRHIDGESSLSGVILHYFSS